MAFVRSAVHRNDFSRGLAWSGLICDRQLEPDVHEADGSAGRCAWAGAGFPVPFALILR
jgi:hypothetical protein